MHRTTRSARRVLLVPVLLLCLMLAGSVPAAAYSTPLEQKTGQTGPYDFRDSWQRPTGAVDCDYRKLANGDRRIKHFQVRTPRVWWLDTNSSVDDQHGMVGWRIRFQEKSDRDDHPTPWTTVYKSGIQKRTAYEGAYDNAFKAQLRGPEPGLVVQPATWSTASSPRCTGTSRDGDGQGPRRATGTTSTTRATGVPPSVGYCLNKISGL